MKNVLIVAFHFPPMGGSSGGLRSLKFTKYLAEHGWQPTVLTVNPRVYDQLDESGLNAIPENVRIIRAFGLDAKKHLSIKSRYPRSLATPDRWISWALGAVPAGLNAIRKHKIDAIFSTYPIATTVLIGLILQRLAKRPWIADFRDPMTEENYPPDPRTRSIYQWIEAQAMQHASRIVFTTDATRKDQELRHPIIRNGKSIVISNGYDEDDFRHLEANAPRDAGAPVRLVHGGVIYPEDRDPRPFFGAIRKLRDTAVIAKENTKIELRGSGLGDSFQAMVREYCIDDIVHFMPSIPYRESLSDAAAADGLLVLQGQSCDRQIPAKVYEYLRIGNPIFSLTTQSGETAKVLDCAGGATIVDISNEEEIARALSEFLNQIRAGTHTRPDQLTVESYSRSSQAVLLADCLNRLTRS